MHHSAVTTEVDLTMMFDPKFDHNGSSGAKWNCTETATCLTVGEIARCWEELQLVSGGLAVATAGQMYAYALLGAGVEGRSAPIGLLGSELPTIELGSIFSVRPWPTTSTC